MVFENAKVKFSQAKAKNSRKGKDQRKNGCRDRISPEDTVPAPNRHCDNTHAPRSHSFPKITACVPKRRSSLRDLFGLRSSSKDARASFRSLGRKITNSDRSTTPVNEGNHRRHSFLESDEESQPELIPLSILDEEEDRSFSIYGLTEENTGSELRTSVPQTDTMSTHLACKDVNITRRIGRSQTIPCMNVGVANPSRPSFDISHSAVPNSANFRRETSAARFVSAPVEQDTRRKSNYCENSHFLNKVCRQFDMLPVLNVQARFSNLLLTTVSQSFSFDYGY